MKLSLFDLVAFFEGFWEDVGVEGVDLDGGHHYLDAVGRGLFILVLVLVLGFDLSLCDFFLL